MKYIINLYNTVDAQAVADRLGITGEVLSNLKVIHVEDPTQEQVDTWLADSDVKAILEDQETLCTDLSSIETTRADSQPTDSETFGVSVKGDATQSALAFNDGTNDWYYWHLPASSQRPTTSQYTNTYTYTNDGANVDLYVIDSGVSGACLQTNGGAAANAGGDVLGIMHPEFEDPAFSNGSTANSGNGDQYRVMHQGVGTINIGSGSGVGGGGWQNEDTQGHGTYCAIFAAGKLAGMAKKAYIWAVKVMDAAGTGSNSGLLSDLQLGMDAVIAHVGSKANGRPSIANISIGVPFYREVGNIYINEVAGDTINELLDDHEKLMGSANIFVCRSAGNGIKDNSVDLIGQGPVQASFVTGPRTGATIPTNPWNIEGIAQEKFGVGALEPVAIGVGDVRQGHLTYNLQLSEFSNYGNAVEISAPGDALVCKFWNADDHLLNGTYVTNLAGTSFSAPIVAGYVCIRQSIVPMEALGLTKQFIKDSSSRPHNWISLEDFTHPHEQKWPIVNAIKYINSPSLGKNDNIQTLYNSDLVAIRVNPYLYGVKTNTTDTHELEHSPSTNGCQSKLAREDYFCMDEAVKTDAGGVGIPYLHGEAHRVKFRFFGYLDLAPGDPNGGSTLAAPSDGYPVVDVESSTASNGPINLQVLTSKINSAGTLCRVWLTGIPTTPSDWPNGQPFDVPAGITTGVWNGKFLTQANASGVYFGKIENMNIATTSTITDNVSALDGWIVLKARANANDNVSVDGDGLKVANLSGTNALGVDTNASPNVTYDAGQWGVGNGVWDGLHWRDGVFLNMDSNSIGTVGLNALYDSQANQTIRDYLPIQETGQNILFNWYVEKELQIPHIYNNANTGNFISTTPQTITAKQNETISLNLGMCLIDTNTTQHIGYQHLEVGAQAYTISSGALPAGLSLNTTTGQLQGTLTADIDTIDTFTITAHNVNAIYTFNITELVETGYYYDGSNLKIPGTVVEGWIEVKTDNYQLEVNKNYFIDSGALSGIPMNLIMPDTAKMGDKIVLIDATKTAGSNSWIINPNGLRIDSPGNGTATWTLGTAGIQYEFVYFVSTRSTSEWIVRETAT